jgi:hypothetical protein
VARRPRRIARSSGALTANAAPLRRDEPLGYASELIEPWPDTSPHDVLAPAATSGVA